ncbi:MAG: hypothetical protein JRJ85_06125 [Deltaproteobacteria bacterium]|nr:hypothetical protein [Deltaproteobacteria bacterium]
MEKTLFLLFNHRITTAQEADARKSLGVERIVDLPRDLKTLWCQIPAELEEIAEYLEPVTDWLGTYSRNGDYALIQGDFGACYIMVNFAFKKGLVPVYSTTRREVFEEQDGGGAVKMTHRFEHQIFRKYGL